MSAYRALHVELHFGVEKSDCLKLFLEPCSLKNIANISVTVTVVHAPIDLYVHAEDSF